MKYVNFLSSRLLGVFICVFINLSVYSQIINIGKEFYMQVKPYSVLDTCFMECIYQHDNYDPAMDKTSTEDYILQIGKTVTKYCHYGNYRQDSVLFQRNIKKISSNESSSLFNKYRPKSLLIYKKNDSLTYNDRIFIDNYSYKEIIPDFGWNLLADTMQVCGYTCHKATCTFRGRQWTAWYSDIPVVNGPWKFDGLPGLILRVEDSEREHVISAISIRSQQANILYQDYAPFKTNREKFNETEDYYKKNPGKFLRNSPAAPRNMDGSLQDIPDRKLFYNPIEKE